MAASIGIAVFGVLWLACALAALRVAARLAEQNERHMRHAHGDVHAWSRPRYGIHEKKSSDVVRSWAAAPMRGLLGAWRRARAKHR
ncbi:hypothetical protein ACFFX1_14880 [Dactylosporangium sucinum]|uniref:Uncharacterized protein n=1 Tax=Dactylosporangium sucinum TaxID=1424081 RepID=A0A917U9T4_9ACTN|nr:hypothetical protein [Dactylosporangium sucinum]GGM68481.1 hypothetical protein GCM10007977_082760 [Dactylosporangium sucinum]